MSFWSGHSVYEVPARILLYHGEVEASVLAYLYERANRISFEWQSERRKEIEIRAKELTIARRTGYEERQVRRAIDALEADNCIRVVHRRNETTGQVQTYVYLLLHSKTGNPLVCSPNEFGVCRQNLDAPFITCPKELREVFVKMRQKPARQAYMGALSLASEKQSLSFHVTAQEWQSTSRLGTGAFYAGLRVCRKQGLLSYERGQLTLNDPFTGAPSVRTAKEFVHHENANYKFDFDGFTDAQWLTIVERLLKRKLIVRDDGWTVAGADDLCPFCHEKRSFRVRFNAKEKKSTFKCQSCGKFGRLGQLVHWVRKHINWEHTRQYITDSIAQTQNAHAEI